MPSQTQKSGLFAKLGQRLTQAVEEHKNDPTDYGNQELPAGIEAGIAQLVSCEFKQIKEGKDNAGEWMFYAAGVVVEPHVHEGVPVAGMRTQVMEVLYDTPNRTRKTVSEHLAEVLNYFRQFNVATEQFPSPIPEGYLEAVAANLQETQPFFRFRTWKGGKAGVEQKGNQFFLGNRGPYDSMDALKKANKYWDQEPRVNHQWNGACKYAGGDDPMAGTDDGTSAPPSLNGSGVPFDEFRKQETATAEPEDTQEPSIGWHECLDDLAELADSTDPGSTEAIDKLTAMAKELGAEDAAIEGAVNWRAVAEMIAAVEEAAASGEPEGEPNDQGVASQATAWPAVGQTCKYQVIDSKTKKPAIDPKTKKARKPVQCEITTFDAARGVATLKNLEDGKTLYKGIMLAGMIKE